MIGSFLSCLTGWITSRFSNFPRRAANTNIQDRASSIKYLASGAYLLQTPIIRGEEVDRFGEIKEIVSSLLGSDVFYFVVICIVIVIGLIFLYNRRKSISDFEVSVVPEDTWFITRDDNNRVGIVVSLNFYNRSTRGVYIKDCKLSGYSAKDHPGEIYLKGTEEEQNLNFPEHKHFSRGQDYYLGPYSSEKVWVYYESRAVTMRNILRAPLTIRDTQKKRKSIQVQIPRHADQIAIYREMARMW
jgi:hypothetical protein